MLTSVTTNYKQRETKTYTLDKINLIVGPNKAGKTGVVQSISLLTSKIMDDVLGRDGIKDDSYIKALAGGARIEGTCSLNASVGHVYIGDRIDWVPCAERITWGSSDVAALMKGSGANLIKALLTTANSAEDAALSDIPQAYKKVVRDLMGAGSLDYSVLISRADAAMREANKKAKDLAAEKDRLSRDLGTYGGKLSVSQAQARVDAATLAHAAVRAWPTNILAPGLLPCETCGRVADLAAVVVAPEFNDSSYALRDAEAALRDATTREEMLKGTRERISLIPGLIIQETAHAQLLKGLKVLAAQLRDQNLLTVKSEVEALLNNYLPFEVDVDPESDFPLGAKRDHGRDIALSGTEQVLLYCALGLALNRGKPGCVILALQDRAWDASFLSDALRALVAGTQGIANIQVFIQSTVEPDSAIEGINIIRVGE